MAAAIPSGLLARLKASLQTPAHGWTVMACTENERREAAIAQSEDGISQPAVAVVIENTVCLMTTAIRHPVGTKIALQVTVVMASNSDVCRLHIGRLQLAVTDAELRAAVLAMASAWQVAELAALNASLAAAGGG